MRCIYVYVRVNICHRLIVLLTIIHYRHCHHHIHVYTSSPFCKHKTYMSCAIDIYVFVCLDLQIMTSKHAEQMQLSCLSVHIDICIQMVICIYTGIYTCIYAYFCMYGHMGCRNSVRTQKWMLLVWVTPVRVYVRRWLCACVCVYIYVDVYVRCK